MKSIGVVVSSGLVSLALVLAACGDSEPEEANPASQFCIDRGGQVDVVEEEGGEVGYCVLPDGSRVDEWEYFRENSPSGSWRGPGPSPAKEIRQSPIHTARKIAKG